MFRSALLLGTLVCCAISPGCPAPASGDPADAALANNAFGLDLYQRLAAKDGNLFFSPASVSLALAMTWYGAREATEQQMAGVLHLQGDRDRVLDGFGSWLTSLQPVQDAYTLRVANRLWGDRELPFRGEFLDPLRTRFGAPLEQLDFRADPDKARLTINDWVADRTEQRILDLLVPGTITRDTGLVLTNAIYFLAAWGEPFRDHLTREEPFFLAGGGRVTVPLMERTGSFAYHQTDSVQVVTLPYKADELEMIVLLPHDPAGLPALERSLSPSVLDGWLQARQRVPVRCRIPRFRLEGAFQLPEVLAAMGMPLAFDPARADFSGMTGTRDLFISDVIHRAFVAVDEKGTEAAAATAVIMEKTSVAMPPKDPVLFQADHPFLFLIRHPGSGAILFLGRLQNPAG